MTLTEQARDASGALPVQWTFTGFNPVTRDALAASRDPDAVRSLDLSIVSDVKVERDGPIRDLTMLVREVDGEALTPASLRVPAGVSDDELDRISVALTHGSVVNGTAARVEAVEAFSPTGRTRPDGSAYSEMQIDSMVLLNAGPGGRSDWLVGREVAAPVHDRPVDRTVVRERSGLLARMSEGARTLAFGPKETVLPVAASRSVER